MKIEIRPMETDEEIRGKAFGHWRSWHEAYPGLVSGEYLNRLTREKCEEMAFRWRENILVAKDNGRVIGFVGYGDRDGEAADTGEIFALYVLAEYYGKGVGRRLMEAGLERLREYPAVCLWVLKENARAIRFYEKCGFCADGTETFSKTVAAAEIRMVLKNEKEEAMQTPEVIRAEAEWQRAGAYSVRIQGMNRQHHLSLREEFDEHDGEGTRYIVLLDDGYPVATCRFYGIGPGSVMLGRVVVLPEYRGRKLGNLLIEEAERWIAELGFREVVIESRVVAVGFYEKLGYTHVDDRVIKSGPFDCITMHKLLS